MHSLKLIFQSILLLSFTSVLLLSCGGGGADDKSSDATDASAKPDAAQVVKLEIAGNDAMQFNKKELKAKAGSKVELTLKHNGSMNAQVMGHNVVILKQGVNAAEFCQKAAAASSNGYIPEGSDEYIVHTKMIGGGEETTVTFNAPEKGTYDFVCSFPGHFALMQGKFIVM
ncbi:MAG: azurin [Bacteroidota bacterium]